jgi:cysteate synthase
VSEFKLRCQHPACGKEYSSNAGFRLSCDHNHEPALLLPVYEKTQLTVRPSAPGIFKYADWLPTSGLQLANSRYPLGEPFCYRSYGLARRLGLRRLYIAFSGYWPERGPNLVTRTFKEFEVQCSLAYFLSAQRKTGAPPLVIASAGNTGNSFNFYAALMGFPIYLFVPESGLDNLVLPFATSPFLVAVKGDYSDAIAMADAVANRIGLSRDGGVLNVGRRAGMATAMLNAVTHPEQGSGRLFDHYFQGVGSGSGAIAAWEAVQMLLRDGRYGSVPTKIHMAQNSPFTPIADSWEAGEAVVMSEEKARDAVANVTARVLTNRKPPYALPGGLHNVLTASKGHTWRVNNQRLFQAARLFRAVEGIDIGSAAAVAVDALSQAVEAGAVKSEEAVLLHVTGGGRGIQFQHGMYQAKRRLTVAPHEIDTVFEEIGEPPRIDAKDIDKMLESVTTTYEQRFDEAV